LRPHLVALILGQGDQRFAGLETDHLCHNRACANPAHLRWATHQQNVRNRKRLILTPEEKRANWAAYQRDYQQRQRDAGKTRTPSGRWV
jgi:hypothetical protein